LFNIMSLKISLSEVCACLYLSVCLSVHSQTAEFSRLYDDYVDRVPSDFKELLGLPLNAHGLLWVVFLSLFVMLWHLSIFIYLLLFLLLLVLVDFFIAVVLVILLFYWFSTPCSC
jgi:hypothetical protein